MRTAASFRMRVPGLMGYAEGLLGLWVSAWALCFPLIAAGATGTIQDVQHVVIFMEENRSFDHYFGSLKGVRGFGDPAALTLTNGNSVFYQPDGTNYVLPIRMADLCATNCLNDFFYTHKTWNGGKQDQFIPFEGAAAMAYHDRQIIPFAYALADAYTICDAYYCAVQGPTDPNRLYLWTGSIDPEGVAGGPAIAWSKLKDRYRWTTYPERLEAAGVTWRVYQETNDYWVGNDLTWFAQYQDAKPGEPLYDRGQLLTTNLVQAFRYDVTNNSLPQVSWIVAPYDYTEHPPHSPLNGQYLVREILNALASNPAVFNSTVFILTYDEAGGRFDHVPPPTPRPGTPGEFVYGMPIGLGMRVPMIVISPWSRGGYVCSQVFDHTSVIRFLETWTGVVEPNITAWRRRVCGDLTSAFDFANPDFSVPVLPSVNLQACGHYGSPVVPSPQHLPSQEPGNRPARPLPYGPETSSSLDAAGNRFWLTLMNSGTASVHYSVYPGVGQTNGPWEFDVIPGQPVPASFAAATNGDYDFTCYGPNCFLRRFAGNILSNSSQMNVTCLGVTNYWDVLVAFQNSSTSSVSFIIVDPLNTNGTQIIEVPPLSCLTNSLDTRANDGWYNLTITSRTSPEFLRRFVGRLIPSFPSSADPDQLGLSFQRSGNELTLSFPAWAAHYSLESTADLNNGAWTVVPAQPLTNSYLASVKLPLTNDACFFRLRNPAPAPVSGSPQP